MFFILFVFFCASFLVFAHFAGYVYILAFFSKIRPRPLTDSATKTVPLPRLYFIVPVYNEAALMTTKLQNYLQLDYPSNLRKLIVVDGGSTDGTVERCSDFFQQYPQENLTILVSPKPGKIQQLNFALRDIPLDAIVVVSDCDAFLLNRNSLRIVVDYLHKDEVELVGGWVNPAPGQSPWNPEYAYWDKQNRMRHMESLCYSSSIVVAPLYAFHHHLIPQGFPDDCVADDVYISLNAHINTRRVLYLPEVEVIETRFATSVSGLFSHKFRKAHAYTTELLRVIHRLPLMGKRVKFLYAFKLFQFFYLSWTMLFFFASAIGLMFYGRVNIVCFVSLFIVLAMAVASLLMTPPNGKSRGGFSFISTISSLSNFALFFAVLLANFFTFPFWSQDSRYKRVEEPDVELLSVNSPLSSLS